MLAICQCFADASLHSDGSYFVQASARLLSVSRLLPLRAFFEQLMLVLLTCPPHPHCQSLFRILMHELLGYIKRRTMIHGQYQ